MRLQFEMTEERVKEIDDLIERLGLKTRVNLLNEALTLYEWAIRERESGRIIASVDEAEDKYKEVDMPGFPPVEEFLDFVEVLASLWANSDTGEKQRAIIKLLYAFEPDTRLSSPVTQRDRDKVRRYGQIAAGIAAGFSNANAAAKERIRIGREGKELKLPKDKIDQLAEELLPKNIIEVIEGMKLEVTELPKSKKPEEEE